MICKQSESGVGEGRYQEDFFFCQLWVLEVEFARRGTACEDTCNEIQSPGFVFLHENEQNVRSEQQQRSESVWCTLFFTGRKNVEESWVLHLLYLYPCKYVSLHPPRRNPAFPEQRGFPEPALCYSLLYKKLLLPNISKPVLKVASMFFKVYFVIHIFATKVTVLFFFCPTKHATTFLFVFIKDQFSFSECLTFLCNCWWIVVVLKKKKKKDVFDKFPKDFKDSFKRIRNMFLNISIWLFPLHFFPNCYLIGNNDLMICQMGLKKMTVLISNLKLI